MRTCGKIMNMLGSFLPVKAMVVAVASLAMFSLMANAATVEVWQFDNFFSNVKNGVPEELEDLGKINETTIAVGDTVKWTNNGTTEHTTTNADDFAIGIFAGDLWDSDNMAVGDSFSHTFDEAGVVNYFCKVHGEGDMEGTIIVGDGDGSGNGEKSFTFVCDQPMLDWIVGLELLELELGDEVGCTLTLTDPRPGVTVKVLNRSIFRDSVEVDPSFCETDENGQCDFTIEAVSKGINWAAWGVANSDGDIVFNNNAYDNGTSWGTAVSVKGD